MTPRRRLSEVRLAMMMLTRLPMGTLPEPVPSLTQARWAFPLAGLPVGLAMGLVLWAAQVLGLPPLAAGFVALAVAAVLTGGLHHDGLADFVDGMGGRDGTRRLEIMRDSRIGSYGVVALVLSMGLSASALGSLPGPALAGLLLVAVASRLAMLLVLDLLPPARADGMGRMAAEARDTAAWRVWLPGAALVLLVTLATGPMAIGVLAAMALAAAIVALQARRLLGGQTGDVLGAAQLCSETAGLLVLSMVLG
ncbi:adenosylcobinamide-GDP ribazoletransferase [Maliponia aquimaris]|uniref:Adenosylcobinamide-GDP ribazoletransferase n=1 Tax=Maliponia aquimaris TaxID=1673631 RepID=A0A238K1Z5_9RHOB|nr:adenosylcobinamide-GDP ribazoletransferase [Maliponia aquimaris]SMX36931.1 Cobalamin synthase [Maliponia aquimaris]